jgi:hypothetical protein
MDTGYMIYKKIAFLFLLTAINVYPADSGTKTMKVTSIPLDANRISLDATNSNKHRLTVQLATGEIVQADGTWTKEAIINDYDALMQRRRQPSEPRNQTMVSITNQNDHVIIQNNSQKQTVQRRPKKHSEDLKVPANPSWYAMITSGLSNNKFALVLGALGLGWATMVAKLLYTSYAIAQYDGWGTWYGHLALENGYQGDQAALAQKLFIEIQKRYQNKNINFLSPLVHFMNDIDEETQFLKNFIHIHELLTATKLSMVFPSQLDVQATALVRIARLEFLKNVVIAYAAEYKVN